MTDWGLAAVVAAALLFAAACTVLPGMAAVLRSVFRRGQKAAVLGPLFWYELTRLARRGQQPRLRALYAGVLLIGLLVTYLNEFHDVNAITLIFGGPQRLVPLDRMASFSERYLTTFLFCQLIVIILITPVYAGGAVPEERDRGTLDFLRTSLLTNREIIAAYFTARLIFIAGLVLTGLPILGLVMLFGGIDGNALIGGFVVALMTVLNLGSFCLFLGVQGRSLREVLVWAFCAIVFVVLLGTCCVCVAFLGTISPFTMTYRLLNPQGWPPWGWSLDIELGVFVAVHGLLAVLFTWLSIARIRVPPPAWRGAVIHPPRQTQKPQRPQTRTMEPVSRRRERPTPRSFHVPRLGNADPLLWKERYFSGRLSGFERGLLSGCLASLVTVILFIVGLWLFVAVVELAANNRDAADMLNPLARYCGFVAAVALAPAVGIRSAASIARERQQQTLDALFSLPISRRDVLWAKWLAALYWVRGWFIGLGVVVLIAAGTGSIHLVGLLVAAAILAAFVLFANTLGLWLSIRCLSTTRAVTWLMVVVLALFLAPLLLSTLVRSAFQLANNPAAGYIAERFIEALSVPYAVYQTLFSWNEFDPQTGYHDFRTLVLIGLLAALVFFAVTWVIWRIAVRAIERDGK
jgi:ABC-type transport system involved in multi-copper enzyme maturation permease subunit